MPEKQVVIGTITELAPNHVVVNTLEYGYITIKRDENWDGGVCWDFTKQLKLGDQVDIFLHPHKNKTSYGFYTLGSQMSSTTRNPKEIAQNKKLIDFIEKKEQEAVVIDYWYSNDKYNSYNSQPTTHIKCWNPVWKEIEFDTLFHIPLRYNDVIIIKKHPYMYTKSVGYDFVENKTLKQEKQQIIKEVLLRDFNDAERQKILLYQANTNQK